MQNLMMQHADSRTFLRHYLPRRVTVDTAAIVRGLDPQDSIMRSACNMSRWIDPNRPWSLTQEQADSVNEQPAIRSLLAHRQKLKRRVDAGDPKYIALNKRITSERNRSRAALLTSLQKAHDHEAPISAIQRQLAGVRVHESQDTIPLFSQDTLPAQRRLVETMILAQPAATLEAEQQRRDDAIHAVITYCRVEEGDMVRGGKRSGGRRTVAPAIAEKIVSREDEALRAAMLSAFIKQPSDRPTVCFMCLGNTRLPQESRTYDFSAPSALTRHFKRKHLQYIDDDSATECSLCELPLKHKMHLQNHALRIHGTVS